jgi:AI-2E family transporter
MDPNEHILVTGSALKNWAVAQMQDSIAVALLWLIGLWILKVPWAPLWAVLAAALQIIPHLGAVLSRSPCAGGIKSLARLGASPLRPDPVRGNRSRGRPAATAVHHAARGQSADVGLDPRAAHPRVRNSVLGIPPRPTAPGSDIRVQGKTTCVGTPSARFSHETHRFESIHAVSLTAITSR